jgi:uncharacterized protein
MAWLLRAGDVLAAAEVAASRRARRRGLLGRDGVDGALLIDPGRAIHTVGMRFTIDVAYCRRTGDELEVLEVCTMVPWRIGVPRLRARCVIEAEAGAFDRWGLAAGDVLQLK